MTKQRGQPVIDKILDTAERLFYKQGYHNTGTNQVIEEADIAKASLYKHFETKDDLMLAYVQRLHQQWFERFEGQINKVTGRKEKLLAIFDYYVERQQFREYGGCPFIKANSEAGMADPRVQEEITNAKLRLKNFIKQLVMASGHKKILSDKELAETIFLLTEGGVTAGSVFKNGDELKQAKNIIKKLI